MGGSGLALALIVGLIVGLRSETTKAGFAPKSETGL